MAIKTIMVPVGGSAGGEAALAVAADLAKRFGAHIEALYALRNPTDIASFAAEGVPASTLKSIIDSARKNVQAEAVDWKQRFTDFCKANAIPLADKPGRKAAASASWRQEKGGEIAVIGERGRLADLIVMDRTDDSWPAPAVLEVALLETGRPVLIVPKTKPKTIGTSVAIGWNGSAEAASAVAASGPFIGTAKSVVVLSTADGTPSGLGPKDLVAHLAWHGIDATAKSFKGGILSVGKALLAEAAKAKADLLVMGGYGHSRGREMIFGGVTRHVLAEASIPVLMLH